MLRKAVPLALGVLLASACDDHHVTLDSRTPLPADAPATVQPLDTIKDQAGRTIDQGRQTFRFDTFGDEAFWGGMLKLHLAVAGAANGGVGPGLSPKSALALGLKVDMAALPADVIAGLQAGTVDLDSPATTLTLLRIDAIVGVKGVFAGNQLQSIGIQCALCHSTVDDAFAPGVGRRLDGWANRDLDVGQIVALAPDLTPFATLLGASQDAVRAVFLSWGPGRFDAELELDGKAFRPDGKTAATLIPPAFGQAGASLHTSIGWGSTPHWNAFVANLDMHGQGNFFDPRLDDAAKFPIAAANRLGHVTHPVDMITAKLAGLQFYQLALLPPIPPVSSFDQPAAARGAGVFAGKAKCSSCHFLGLTTDAGWPMHSAAEIGIDDFQAQRGPEGLYRTAPLRGLFTHMKGGFYHDGRFATLLDVVEHYDAFFGLGLSTQEKADLVEYLKSL